MYVKSGCGQLQEKMELYDQFIRGNLRLLQWKRKNHTLRVTKNIDKNRVEWEFCTHKADTKE